ncbi:MAG: phage portal protein [Pseudomonadota bacterium]
MARPLVAIENLTHANWAPRDYAGFARHGMMRNAVVYRCVRLISEAAASVPLLAYEGDAPQDQSPVQELMMRPAPGQTATDFFETWYGHLLVSGNAYAEAVAGNQGIAGLHLLRPDRVRTLTDQDGWPTAHEYRVNGRRKVINGDVVDGVPKLLHLRLFHPFDDHYGLSPIEAAATAIDIHNSCSRWSKALLDNAARPSGALVYNAAEQLTAEQFARLKAELEDSFQGARNAGRPLLLEGGLEWKTMSLSPRDMDSATAKNGAARDIALALGVPPMLLGIPGDNHYDNYREANRAFWRQTVLPLVNRTARAFGNWLAPAFAQTLSFRPDLDAVEALRTERDALWDRLNGASFLSTNEKRTAVGYGPIDADA